MIPPDLAARLRMLTEASFFSNEQATQPVQQLARVQAIQAEFPELTPGTRFTALLQRPLPDGTFKAMVAGQEVTLALDTAAKAGDTLELVVTQTSPRAVVARLADMPADEAADASARPALSQTGRLINALLTGQPETPALSLRAGQALLPGPPAQSVATANAGATPQLANALGQAVAQSGLFYESHLADWLAGKVSTQSLQQEPQGAQRQPPPLAANAPRTEQGPGAAATQQAQRAALGTSSEAEAQAATLGRPAAALMPDHLTPVVHQQLETLATQNLVLQGQAWPGQWFQLEIEDPHERGRKEREGSSGGETAPEWKSTLRVTMPAIGGIEANMILTPAGLALRLRTDQASTAQILNDAREDLRGALEAAGMALTGISVEARGDEHE